MANDLIWSFYINNYLLGKEPPAFDLLFWNSDSTRVPETVHSFLVRNLFLENKLIEADALRPHSAYSGNLCIESNDPQVSVATS